MTVTSIVAAVSPLLSDFFFSQTPIEYWEPLEQSKVILLLWEEMGEQLIGTGKKGEMT